MNKKGVTLLELVTVLAILALLTGGTMLGLRQTGRRALQNASLQLQADMRYAQRRAVLEGRQFGIVFEEVNNRYRVISTRPRQTLRTVYVSGGARLFHLSGGNDEVLFHPRGTPSRVFTVTLAQGSNRQSITWTVSGARIEIHDILQADYE